MYLCCVLYRVLICSITAEENEVTRWLLLRNHRAGVINVANLSGLAITVRNFFLGWRCVCARARVCVCDGVCVCAFVMACVCVCGGV